MLKVMNCRELGLKTDSMCYRCIENGEEYCLSGGVMIVIRNWKDNWSMSDRYVFYFTTYSSAPLYQAIAKKYYPYFWKKLETTMLLS